MKKVFFKRKFTISNAALFFILILVSFFLFRKLAMFILVSFFAALFTYANYYIKLPFDISPVLILSLLIAREFSFVFAIVFILLSGIAPMVLAGGSFDHTTIFYLSIIIGVSFLSSLSFYSYYLTLAILMVLHHVIAFFGSLSFGHNPQKEAANLVLKIFVDSFYIILFSGLF